VIVKRQHPKKPARGGAIIRRSRPAVGTVPRKVVRRSGGVISGGVIGGEGPRGPRFHTPALLAWRPSKGLLTMAAAMSVLALFAYGAFWVWSSPIFKVSDVQVTGNSRITTPTIIEASGVIGESMFNADLSEVQRQMYALPLIYNVSIERDWPNTIRIVVEERQAWGTWEQANVEYTIDREGVVLGVGPGPENGPVIRSSEEGSRITGDRVDYQAVDAAAEIYEKLPRYLGTTVSEVAFTRGQGVTVTTTANQVALLGDSSSITYKLAVWSALATEAQQRRINYTTIDLRYGNRPVLN
jgi:cell division protein FtsQ